MGEHTFTISLQDGTVTVDTDITLTVANVNDAPTLTSSTTASATEDEAYTYTITGEDIDGDALTFTVSNLPSWLSFDGTDLITGTPTNDEVGEHTFSISLQDGTVTVDTDVIFTVTNVNDAPELSQVGSQQIDAGKVLEGVLFTVTNVDNDIALSDITATSSNQALVADDDITIIAGTDNQYELQLTSKSGVSGDLSISITVSDGVAFTTASFDLTVNLILSIADQKSAPSLMLSPNPVSQLLHLDYSSSSDYQYSIYSIEGQLMFQDNFKKSTSPQPSIDVSTYPKGMYIIRLVSGRGDAVVSRFVKR